MVQQMSTYTEVTDLTGAMSLLEHCVKGKNGERLLIVREPISNGFYDEHAPKLVAEAGRSLGMQVYETESRSAITSEDERAILLDSLRGFDHVVFFSRVGDQIRFDSKDTMPSSTMCYTLNHESLSSQFGKACHHGMSEIKTAIDKAFMSASQVHVTCPRGTDYSGCPDWSLGATEVTVKRFPLLVPQPIPADGFSGRVVLSRFLIGTGSQFYEPYYQALPNDVIALVENNKIAGFDGEAKDVELVQNHYKTVSEQLSVEPWYVDSWHAGIHPGCNFEMDAENDIMRWSGTAFGNPRILHFHTCGEYAPGEICWNVLDPTVSVDGVAVWEAGRLYPERLSDGAAILRRHPNLAALFANPVRQIGLSA